MTAVSEDTWDGRDLAAWMGEIRADRAGRIADDLIALIDRQDRAAWDRLERAVTRTPQIGRVTGFGACQAGTYPSGGAEEHIEAGWA